MKIRITLAVCTALLLAACGGKGSHKSGYTIEGDLPGISGTVYLTVFEGKMPRRIDSTEVNNGRFTFKGERDLPILASIENRDKTLVRFFLENSPITITSTEDGKTIQISGSASQELYEKYRSEADTLASRLEANSELSEEAQEEQFDAFKHQFVKNHLNSVVGAYVLYRELSYTMTYQELYDAVNAFDPAIQKSIYLQLVKSMADTLKKTAVGEHYTDVSAPDSTGVVVPLSSLVGPGKYILLDFWASWCPPCRAECPNLVAAYKDYAPKGFEIYAVSLDRNWEAWLKGIKDLGLTWKHVSTLTYWESDAADAYGVRSIPANVLIGPDGIILARNLMGHELQTKLAELIK